MKVMVAMVVYLYTGHQTLDTPLEAHLAVLEQARYELALLDALDLFLGQRLFGTLHHLARLVLPGDGLGALLAANANFVDFRDALAAVKLGMALLGVVLKHDGFY